MATSGALVGMLGNASAENLVAQDNWLNWRGPNGNGYVSDRAYPKKWSESENVAWKLPIPGRGASTPVVVNDLIILTAGIEGKNQVLAIDQKGKEQWRIEAGSERQGKHKKATGSNPSPVSDGKLVYVYFKSGDLACCNLQGDVVWKKNIQSEFGEDTLWWDLGTSPILTNDCVVVAVMQTGPSFLVAFNKKSGEVEWKTERQMNVNEESNQAYTTPVIAKTSSGEEILLTLGADFLTAHNASNGKELWKLGGFNPTNHKYFRTIASPVVAGDLVVCPYARGETVTGVRWKSDVAESDRIAWKHTDFGSDVPTPVVSDKRVYVCGDKGDIHCLDAQSGKTIWKDSLPKNRNAYSSSPIIAGGHLYFTREDGTTFVIKDSNTFEIVSENPLDASTVATPVFVNGKLFIRTFDSLYCIQ